MNRYDKGLSGEQQAEAYLVGKCGMRCIYRRYRGGAGEIDLVMMDGDTVVFVEVKARPNGRAGDGLMAVTPDKVRRLRDAALHYLVENALMDQPVRFDVVEITLMGVRYVVNAF